MNQAFALGEKTEEAKENFFEACLLEKQAADLVENCEKNEPSRSMLYHEPVFLHYEHKALI